jgi:hypothetical protein
LFFTTFIGYGLLAQSAPGDSVFYNRSLDTLQYLYRNAVRTNLHIYTGNEYFQYGLRTKGNPFFRSDSLEKGDISYGGVLYRAVPMRYDLLYDDVILNDYSGNFPIRMISSKIDSFELSGHRFLHFSPDSTESAGKPPGFFDLIYSDTLTQVYVKRQKKLEMPLDPGDSTPAYREYDTYFMALRGQTHKLGDTRELVDLLKDKKDDLKKFARSNGIRLRDINDESVKKLITYYVSLRK